MIKKASKQAEEGVEVAEEVGAGEVAKETQTKRNEAHKTDRQLAGSSEGRARGVQNWNEMPCQSIFAWHAASSQPPHNRLQFPLSLSHHEPRPNNVRLSISATFTTLRRRKGLKCFIAFAEDNICQ